MENIFKNKLNLFYLAVSIALLIVIIVIVTILIFPKSPQTPISSLPTPTVLPTTPITPPILRSTVSPSKQGVFTVTFPKAPKPEAITITLNSLSTNPKTPALDVPFTSEFQNNGTLLVITTKNPVQSNVTYALYVRLVSNNHIVVKHLYESKNGVLTIIDTD